ncbi:HAD family hydrolase [Kyrpidia sp.]|uniref:Cof-type HAD-IIB family hydrolase n=1 Tax=Kyrpidia sp. TaxID=2073077 RepID=UPI00258937AF|nr:HAD family hydrolase [Kyrpidia sp.]MCL6575106.1 Cof-type HAD-IIB family hydrolase [Kyrpidia sp.]
MRFRAVFFDVDGTLLTRDMRLPESVKWAVNRLREQGVAVGIATGRSYAHTEAVMKQLGIDMAVLNNGGLALRQGRILAHRPIHPERILRILGDVEDADHALVLHGKEFTVVNKPEDAYFLRAYHHLRVPFPSLFRNYQGEPVYQINLFCPEDEVRRYTEAYPDLTFRRWFPGSYDVNAAGVHKAAGIAALIGELGMSWDEVVTFGDADNDIQMLRAAGLGVAMGGGLPAAQEVADVVIGRPEEDAIWNFVRSNLAQEPAKAWSRAE